MIYLLHRIVVKGKLSVLLIYTDHFILDGTSRAQTSYDVVLGISVLGVVYLSYSMSKICDVVVCCRFYLSWSI